ncbi:hypothetical protein ACOMHN_051901 [Nucella lapillus]
MKKTSTYCRQHEENQHLLPAACRKPAPTAGSMKKTSTYCRQHEENQHLLPAACRKPAPTAGSMKKTSTYCRQHEENQHLLPAACRKTAPTAGSMKKTSTYVPAACRKPAPTASSMQKTSTYCRQHAHYFNFQLSMRKSTAISTPQKQQVQTRSLKRALNPQSLWKQLRCQASDRIFPITPNSKRGGTKCQADR